MQRLKMLFSEAYEIMAYIAGDPESLELFTQFAKDYAGAQSSLEWAEFAGGGIFEIVLFALLLMFTGGIGNIAQGASKIRHASKLRSLGPAIRELGKLLKKKKLQRKVRAQVDVKKKITVERPEDRKLTTVPVKKLQESKVPCFHQNKKGTAQEYDRQLKGQQDGLNDMTADEYLAGRKAYTGDRASTTEARQRYKENLTEKYRKSGYSVSDSRIMADKKMKTLNALHNPDMIAGGKDVISDFGDASVNKSIGSQWRSRVTELDKAAEDAIKNGQGNYKMNANLHRCK